MIEVSKLVKGYAGSGTVVHGVDLHVEKGTIHGLIGHNGSGKTTIIKCLTGIFPPDEGEVKVAGQTVYDNPEVKGKIGYVSDGSSILGPGYKIQRLVEMYDHIFPNFSKEEFYLLNKMFQINANKRVSQLSKGQQMRVSFMLNMARRPEVLILDEPTSGLDAMAKKDLLDTLVSAVEHDEMTVLISSHHLEQLEKICDAVTVISHGRVDIEDELDEVTGQIMKYQVVFPEGAPKGLYERKEICDISNVGSVYTIVVPRSAASFEEDMRRDGAVVVEPLQVGLEESFVYMNRLKERGE